MKWLVVRHWFFIKPPWRGATCNSIAPIVWSAWYLFWPSSNSKLHYHFLSLFDTVVWPWFSSPLETLAIWGCRLHKGGLNTNMGVLNPFYLESTSISRCLPNVSILISQEFFFLFLKEKIKTNHAIIWQKLPQVETTFAHLVCPLFLMSKNCKLIAAAKPPSAKLKGACLLAPIKFDPFISTK